MNAIAFVHEQLTGKKEFPKFKAGDNITVNYKIIEGSKERIQSFKGDVIKKQGTGATASFTVRKISDGVGVERVFPFFSPNPVMFAVLNCSTSVAVAVKVQESVKSVWLYQQNKFSDKILKSFPLKGKLFLLIRSKSKFIASLFFFTCYL